MYGSRRSGAAVVIVIVIVAILAIAGAGVWWFVLRSTPEKTLRTMFAAQKRGDGEAFAACMTERSQAYASAVGNALANSPQEFEYTLGDAEIDGDKATVPVTMPIPERVSQYSGQTEVTLKYALQKEGGAWKVDMQDTIAAMMGGLMGGMGGGPPGGGPPQ